MSDSPDLRSLFAGHKIAHLTTVDMTLEYLLLAQLQAAGALGAEIIGISAPGSSAQRLKAAGIRHLPLASSTRKVNVLADLRVAAELWRILRAERPDILHTHNPKPGIYGRCIGRVAGVPTIINTVHGLYATEDHGLFRRIVVYALEAIASRFSDAEMVQNQEDLALMRRWHLAPLRRLHYLGNGVDLERFRPDAVTDRECGALRSSLGFDETTVVVGIVARLVHEKGYRELIEAAETFGPEVGFLAVGGEEPSKADGLTRAEIARGERAGIRFQGHRNQPTPFYAAMDIVVLPSYREGMPRSLMEASAMGKPLIATDVRGCRQVVLDGINGRLIPVRDSERLASAIRELVNDAERRREWGAQARRLAQDSFNETDVVRRVMDIYAQQFERHARRQPDRRTSPASDR